MAPITTNRFPAYQKVVGQDSRYTRYPRKTIIRIFMKNLSNRGLPLELARNLPTSMAVMFQIVKNMVFARRFISSSNNIVKGTNQKESQHDLKRKTEFQDS